MKKDLELNKLYVDTKEELDGLKNKFSELENDRETL